MFHAKLTVIFLFVFLGIISCFNPKSARYSVAESKTYEASLFRQHCSICHGIEGEGKTLDDGKQVPNLRDGEFKYKTDAEIYRHISEGGNGMVPFRDQLTEREINLMVNFVQKDLRKGQNPLH